MAQTDSEKIDTEYTYMYITFWILILSNHILYVEQSISGKF